MLVLENRKRMDQLIQFLVFLGLGKEINWMKLEDAYVEAKKRYGLIPVV